MGYWHQSQLPVPWVAPSSWSWSWVLNRSDEGEGEGRGLDGQHGRTGIWWMCCFSWGTRVPTILSCLSFHFVLCVCEWVWVSVSEWVSERASERAGQQVSERAYSASCKFILFHEAFKNKFEMMIQMTNLYIGALEPWSYTTERSNTLHMLTNYAWLMTIELHI